MQKKIKIKICTGTNCYVMGGADLLTLEDNLPEELLSQVEIEGSNCLGFCKDSTSGKSPFVMVDDKLITGANITSLITKIKNIVKDRED